ncbi:MAG: 50S ribosomal protein L13 [Candidatus Nealsonbacteria bacterium CG_4_9_14_3_um_filter_35_11]|uniref:Large ribosomal subunit protein uL13 n=2 Tax=Candidatus Nealsoniibacteriota TaxID=1817911 RepID=A0A2M7DBA8_9BACT|nr:MAG: 50S ribosomal protein L13 [Candidatus Nealsonbacteria bacterium CG11_big_fil_rev_8_21_14_0_20_35_11]PIV45741.1 MAG: 50S ribosomal protein L13 [Candidatus Nealsonbacteria bacterium CG02_land_8_20_14_3_00_34_20]PIW92649.1 MAG: 50S ribosomal protein L13 [Candidatus Nealsonbacteria bacterium CG_4_8_14_3_um_filter_34_13]PIZ90106.1 MAG: 50S ribosomal protein L13 [Candidatus Nealsonbacteria bacterium CG_4_10_14_0_2_um_filter_35_20]PJA84763.1 MAG: 50S ribosomal protein L13 [Candidatus Nealsonba
MKRETYTIDAAGKSLGRLATEIVVLLRGKHKPSFVPNQDRGDFVTVKNINKINFTGKKLIQKKYFRHSEFIGKGKEIPMKEIFRDSPQKVLKRAVFGMLPKNKLRSRQIKRLKVE